jgi:hypothetical protein
LEAVKNVRNALIHGHDEPSQEITIECLALATELLARVTTRLKARAPRPLLIAL